MEYASPEKRRTKKDLKRKRKYRAYKKGGRFRSIKFDEKKKRKK
jgi:hypothetical protein